MKTESEINQKLKEFEDKRENAIRMDYQYLKMYLDGLIDGLGWVKRWLNGYDWGIYRKMELCEK